MFLRLFLAFVVLDFIQRDYHRRFRFLRMQKLVSAGFFFKFAHEHRLVRVQRVREVSDGDAGAEHNESRQQRLLRLRSDRERDG